MPTSSSSSRSPIAPPIPTVLSAFIVEKDTKGFRPGKKENKLGLRASDTAELIFEDCVMPVENLLGKEGEGFIDAMRVLDGGRISIAALSLGMAEGAYEAALNYSKERKQFGKASAIFRPFSGNSPTWRPRSKRRSC